MKSIKTVLLDGRFPGIGRELEDMGYRAVFTEPAGGLPAPVACHPDMQICRITDKIYVCAPECYAFYSAVLKDCGVRLIKGGSVLGGEYPEDSAYNIARAGNFALLNPDAADPLVLKLLEENGTEIIAVRQGYAKCSTCVVSGNAIITADKGIDQKAEAAGIDSLPIRPGHVRLPGYGYGFIGGASGLIDENLLAFAGDIKLHPDFHKIHEFCDARKVRIIALGGGELTDVGTIMVI